MTSDNLSAAIAGSRKISDDGSLVTYDLTKGVDFSNPQKTAEALANVFFEKDAINWFKISGDHIDFTPTYKVRVVLAEEHNRKLEDTVDDFLKDLQKQEILPTYSGEIKDTAANASRLKNAMVGGSLRSLLFRHTEERVFKSYIQDDLFVDILENLEIKSLDNKDMMDWTNLPL